MKRSEVFVLCLMVASVWAADTYAQEALKSPYAQWSRGPGAGADFFPIAVWLQSPANAGRYREAGFNLYVGLWRGPTDEQLSQLQAAGMHVICSQNRVALSRLDDPTIVGWMHGDEPDNAQSLGEGKGYGPPIPPEKIVADYEKIRAADPTRPILLNLGQGVAWDGWHGRGVRTNHPEDYPEYVKGCDIASFDIYPVAHDRPAVAGKLWYVAYGVERLKGWAQGRPVWNCIECTRISSKNKATPQQVRCEVWMSIVHGSMGLIYFVHEWVPKFDEAALLHDPEMYEAVTRINQRIAKLAPVLNSPTISGGAEVRPAQAEIPIATMVKKHEGAVYLFAVAMREGRTNAKISIGELQGRQTVEVLDEDRTLEAIDGAFEDEFEPWDVHLYRVLGSPKSAKAG
ncbi:MAG TPA: hypothetical protein PK373_06490 [Sedimentisphaerales bacterium]|nr:hypothetical protein [Sedimentisphaerales bacterium]HQG48721.1 hypothetical protein [Sedimentisphaerales bacterium]HQI28515.1 hypothetical protein [Sedimentisphaerales bacterium]